ncbi:polysaccharide biosynthesis protein [Thermococcus celericrescens]|uniref:Polysaccharide biosynthesis protein n=1 Tax=Thermococcus celericrescens TaxID=227598 RepID=A0A100XZD6_9EURY|nr:flippase [Thermococcus celericrescens]KUH34407.1 polysaccharide biosynthesis protein [Thermococcus celericrescens]
MSGASQALQKIARGTGIVFAGTVISMLFGFLSRAVIARYFSTGEYGVFNLALTVLNIALVVATLGFQNALPREVAFYREREPSKVGDLVSTALVIVAASSFVITALLVLGSGFVARVFSEERLVYALRIAALALPFWALTGVVIAVSRGFGRVREQVYFQNIVYPIVWLVLVVLMAVLGLPFASIFWMYILAQSAVFLALIFEVHRIRLFNVKASFDPALGKKLVLFSLPLMFVGILNFLMTWTDTLMLGYYKGSEVVGLYNAATPLARLIPIFLGSASVIYSPIVTSLYAQGKIGEMGRVYQILTKWVFLLTLPIFAVMFLFPEATISFLFGEKYVSASTALQILSLGFMFHTFLGLNGMTLIVIGKPKLNMIGDTFAVISNVSLNLALIPRYGMVGAAVATAVSYFVANVFRSYWLYKMTGIHPFSPNYVKPLGISFLLLGVLKWMSLDVGDIWHAIPVLVIFLAVYALLVLLSRSIDKEDVELLLAVEKRLGVDLGGVKKILGRFV